MTANQEPTGQPGHGWATKPAPSYWGDDEAHPIDDAQAWPTSTFDAGNPHRRSVGLYPPEMRLELE